jgi:hypothetical protein
METFDYQDFKVGDIVTFNYSHPNNIVTGIVKGIELFFATRIAYLKVEATDVEERYSDNNQDLLVKVGDVVDIMHLQVVSFKDAICQANEFKQSPAASQEKKSQHVGTCCMCGRPQYTTECMCEI